MKNINKDFDERKLKNTMVQCKTKQDSDVFLETMCEFGYTIGAFGTKRLTRYTQTAN